MSSLPSQSVLFFRIYREVTMPLYAAMITELCASPHLPFELETTLEDIGQKFIRLADEVNVELRRRGLLDREADPDDTVEAKIEGYAEAPHGRDGAGSAAKGWSRAYDPRRPAIATGAPHRAHHDLRPASRVRRICDPLTVTGRSAASRAVATVPPRDLLHRLIGQCSLKL
ncbi:hypothetical protein [uncultured Methylobacterium sp.]|uniref:hypothetical protein n=1 Tax=uncultured Methylobacterium sp. TaxID=157278 RepID=UPI0035CBE7FF